MRDRRVIAQHVEEDPLRPGPADARIRGTGVAVWALIAYLAALGDDVRQVADEYGLPIEAVEAARAYYRRHRALIDARIAANAA